MGVGGGGGGSTCLYFGPPRRIRLPRLIDYRYSMFLNSKNERRRNPRRVVWVSQVPNGLLMPEMAYTISKKMPRAISMQTQQPRMRSVENGGPLSGIDV